MNLKESIRKVLNEESIQDSLFDMINTDGIKKASKAVGGMNRLIKILNLNEEDLNGFIYQYLTENYYPDYNWGPELFDFYDEEVRVYGSYHFEIDDLEGYAYLGEWDGYDNLYTLFICNWVINDLNNLFNDKWVPIFKRWFEDNSGLEVREIDLEGRYYNGN
jgi:hypothetical protein